MDIKRICLVKDTVKGTVELAIQERKDFAVPKVFVKAALVLFRFWRVEYVPKVGLSQIA